MKYRKKRMTINSMWMWSKRKCNNLMHIFFFFYLLECSCYSLDCSYAVIECEYNKINEMNESVCCKSCHCIKLNWKSKSMEHNVIVVSARFFLIFLWNSLSHIRLFIQRIRRKHPCCFICYKSHINVSLGVTIYWHHL